MQMGSTSSQPAEAATLEGIKQVDQNLDLAGEENMKDQRKDDEPSTLSEDTAEESDEDEDEQPIIGDGEWDD